MNIEVQSRFRLWPAIAATFLLLLFASISFTTALDQSPTFDEPLHLYAGYSYLKWGDFRVNPEHPPLVKMLAALPLMLRPVHEDGIMSTERNIVQTRKDYEWVLADQFLKSNQDVDALFLGARLLMIGLAVALGVVVFLWAREIYGVTAAIVALVIYCFDPNFLAHSSIVHTDVPFTLWFFAGCYFFWRASNRVTWPNLVLMSLCLALAAITKFSFFVIIPVWAFLGLVRVFSSKPQISEITCPALMSQRSGKATLLLLVLSVGTIAAYITIWAVYGFRFDAAAFEKNQMAVGRLLSADSWISSLVVFNSKYFALPEAWVYGAAFTFRSFERFSFLLGDISNHGFWFYFPIAFAVKTPLPTIVMMLIAVVLVVLRRHSRIDDLFLVIPPAAFFAVAVYSHLNIGIRHILPIYPFLFVWLGGAVATISNLKCRIAKGGVLLLGLWLIGASLRVYPNYLAFFNELAGGSSNGHKILVDSNLDWGQDLKGLKHWMNDHGISKIHFAYFGTVDPFCYGIKAIPAPGSLVFSKREDTDHSPPAPYLAISATYLAGLYLPQRDTYAAFRNRRPVASIGNSILIYRLDKNP
ncbi:MAG: ArnT family glycosyltransferase [Alphaproteobacteria bacterium]